jgi:hypothetical protein
MIDYEGRVDRIPDWNRPGNGFPADLEISPRGWKYPGGDWTAAQYPLAAAINEMRGWTSRMGPCTIQVRGAVHGAGHMLGGGNAGGQANKAHWRGTPLNLVLRGKDPAFDELRDITFWTHDGAEKSGGVGYVRFENLTLRNAWGRQAVGDVSNQIHDQSGEIGVVHYHNVHFRGKDTEDFGGFGMKFGVRCTSGLAHRFDKVICHGAQEHAVYCNVGSPGPDGCTVAVRDFWHKGSWRTGFQLVDRPLESALGEPTGHLFFEDVLLHNVNGEGGGGITIAGNWGPITISNYNYTKGCRHSAIAIWHPRAPHQGFRADPDGYYNGSVLLDGITVHTPTANQDAVQVDLARRLQVGRRFDIRSSKTAFDLGKIGPEIPLHLSEHVGFEWANPPGLSKHPGLQRGSGRRITADLWNGSSYNPNVELTDEAIDAIHMLGVMP